ncbi:transcription factor bHLH96-like [Rutidosis leptorrhynchoides]|uniref:transcription factor bHLH96-like n=1 Tax=Rutidosis leptorrhynchoides TaxID=125765 RepID=UPI003A99924C
MALDTIVYPQDQIGNWGYDYLLQEDKTFCGFLESNNLFQNYGQIHANNWDYSSYSAMLQNDNNCYDMKDCWGATISSPEDCRGSGTLVDQAMIELPAATAGPTKVAGVGRRKRRRNKSGKNKEELENQRMTHITVERNRRKQMNEYLAVIRSLMPSSYVQRGDQASIIGGAINFVKELEQQLQTLEVQKRAIDQKPNIKNDNGYSPSSLPFSEFFTFPQYSIRPANEIGDVSTTVTKNRPPAMAEIEVTMVENHANLKILSKKRPKQLLKIVAGLQCLWLTILHLNVTTVVQMVLYSLSVKVEDGCQLSTVDEIADAVNCMLAKIEDEALSIT